MEKKTSDLTTPVKVFALQRLHMQLNLDISFFSTRFHVYELYQRSFIKVKNKTILKIHSRPI
jgi:hypothetical protein